MIQGLEGIRFTPTELRILALLEDGQFHVRAEVYNCFNDVQSSSGNVRGVISFLRKKLLPRGYDITSERRVRGSWASRIVKTYTPSVD